MRRSASAWIAAGLVAIAAPACAVAPSTLQTHSTETASRGPWDAALVLGLLAVLAIVVVFAFAVRRRDLDAPRFVRRGGLILVAGVVVPLAAVIALSVVTILQQDRAAATGREPLQVSISAHQWWWGIVYERSGIATANELTIPVDTDVALTLTSDNVVHAFWVPSLTPAVDVVPGADRVVTVHATSTGTYRGQCAQFCGLAHADMRIVVRVVSRAEFDTWEQDRLALAQRNAEAGMPAGLGVFFVAGCDRCHTIDGTIADGVVGPDLTDVGGRSMLGANVVHNDPGSMGRWISDPASIKPGVEMPAYAGTLTPVQIGALVDYLEGLR